MFPPNSFVAPSRVSEIDSPGFIASTDSACAGTPEGAAKRVGWTRRTELSVTLLSWVPPP